MQAKDIPELAVLIAAARWQKHVSDVGVLQVLLSYGIPAKLAMYKLERMSDRGLLDYGVSCSCAWPTDKGWAEIRRAAIQSAILGSKTAGGGGT